MSELIISDTTIRPGEQKRIELPIALLPTQTMLSIPISVIRGLKDGPRLWISAAVHGDEINGVEVIRRILEYAKKTKIRGTLIAVPVVNVFGFNQQSRYLPDRRDLNRSFPGGKSGSLAGRLAHLFLTEIVAKATHGIDIHTGAIHRSNLPHVRCDALIPESIELAQAFAPEIILVRKSGAGTLRAAATKLQIPNILVEVGEALRFNESYIEECTQDVLRVMHHLDMIDEMPPPPRSEAIIVNKTVWVRARRGGIFHPCVALGETVAKGKLLGKITDVLGEYNGKIIALQDSVVIGMLKNPLVYQGDALIHLAC